MLSAGKSNNAKIFRTIYKRRTRGLGRKRKSRTNYFGNLPTSPNVARGSNENSPSKNDRVGYNRCIKKGNVYGGAYEGTKRQGRWRCSQISSGPVTWLD